MRSTITVGFAGGLLCLVTACSDGNGGVSGAPAAGSSEAPPVSTSESEAAAPAGGQCPVGDWTVATITGKSGAEVNGVPVVAKSGGGFTLALGSDNTWKLAGDNAAVTLEAAGLSVDATVNGTAEGEYAKTGANYTFRQQRASGKVTLTKPVAGVSSWPMDQVGPALAPGGQATLTCGAGTLKLSSESVVLDLTAAGGASGGGAPAPPADTGGAPAGGGSMTITDSAKTRTIDCAGKDVAINGSSNTLTFTGSCGTVSVTGSNNKIKIAKTGQISVTGSFNTVTWSAGNPKTSNTGQRNTITQG